MMRLVAFLSFATVTFSLIGCSSPLTSEQESCFVRPTASTQDSIGGAPLVQWRPETNLPTTSCGAGDGNISNSLNLTQLHGEREFTRNAQLLDLNNDGRQELITKTMNENQVRALNAKTGRTIWKSPMVLPAHHHPQISDLVAKDIDEDERTEILIATYSGHVLCINGNSGSLVWHRRLGYHINNPDLSASLGNITDDRGLELALTVSNEFEWGNRDRPRINQMYNPSVLVLTSDGSTAWVAKHYDENNSNGHKTWSHDVDKDGLAEVFAIGEDQVVAFNNDGTELFTIPMKTGHPDQIIFGDWSSEHSGDEIIYTDGINAIGIVRSTGKLLHHHEIEEDLQGHLQDLTLIQTDEGPRLLAQNIRDKNAKSILYDEDLVPQWVAQLGYNAAMQYTRLIDWTGDGNPEIATGSLSETGGRQCSLQIMRLDGSPIYWHRWRGFPLCVLTDTYEDKIVLGAGLNEGDQGRYSVPSGHSMHLFLINAP